MGWQLSDYESRTFHLVDFTDADRLDLTATKKVSFLVVASDDEETLAPVLRSLAAQTHGKIELLVLDNGSIDQTGVVIEEIARSEPRLRSFTAPDPIDQSEALSRIAHQATGDIVAIIPSTAVMVPTLAAELVELLGTEPSYPFASGIVAETDALPVQDWLAPRLGETTRLQPIAMRRDVLRQLGAVLAGPESAVQELAERYAAAVGSELADLPSCGWVGCDICSATPADEDEWRSFHDEIRRGLRPAFRSSGGASVLSRR